MKQKRVGFGEKIVSATGRQLERDFQPAKCGPLARHQSWLDRHERQLWENPTTRLILCAGKKAETVEYLDLDRSGVHVAEYLTELPPRRILRKKLHDAVRLARARLDTGKD